MLFPGNSRWNPYLSAGDKSSSEMTVRRNRWAASVPPGYFSSTKGHSALRKWSYAPTSRASAYESDIYYPEVYVKPRYYDTTREENDIRREVNSELIYTSNLLDDTYDIAARSRNRDQSLLREATRAVVDTETYSTPRSSVTSRRVRATTVAPRAVSVAPRAVSCPPTSVRRSNQVVVVLTSPAFKGSSPVISANVAMAKREQSLPPLKPSPQEQLERRVSARRVINTAAGQFLLPLYHPYRSSYQPYISLYRPSLYRPHFVRRYLPTTRDVIPDRHPVLILGSPYKRKKFRKAALVGNKVEVTLPHRKRPKSSYAANKMRELKREEREYEVEAVPLQVTTGLKASSVTSVRY